MHGLSFLSLITFQNYSVFYVLLRLKTGCFKLLAGMPKSVLARGLVLNYICCIDLLDCIASKYTSKHTIINNKHILSRSGSPPRCLQRLSSRSTAYIICLYFISINLEDSAFLLDETVQLLYRRFMYQAKVFLFIYHFFCEQSAAITKG